MTKSRYFDDPPVEASINEPAPPEPPEPAPQPKALTTCKHCTQVGVEVCEFCLRCCGHSPRCKMVAS